MEDIILSIPVMKKSVLFPIFKLYCPIVHFYHILHLLSSLKKWTNLVGIFMALNIRQQGQRCLGEPALWLLSLMPRVILQATEQGGERRPSGSFPRLRNGAGSQRKPRGWTFSGKNKGESSTERGLWILAASLPRLGSVTFSPCEETIWGWGKNHPKGLERMVLRANPEEFLFLTGQRGKAAQNTWKEFAPKGIQN